MNMSVSYYTRSFHMSCVASQARITAILIQTATTRNLQKRPVLLFHNLLTIGDIAVMSYLFSISTVKFCIWSSSKIHLDNHAIYIKSLQRSLRLTVHCYAVRK